MDINSKFCDKNYLILKENYSENINKLKVGIHIHIHYIDMIDLFIKHLINFPIFFDLFITVNLKENKDICLKHFTKEKLIKLNNITIKITENIGRDIAPWLIEFANIQDDYDLFCHLHTKKSFHNDGLKKWGEYLIENLISEESAKTILTTFLVNEDISMIFPPAYYSVFPFAIELDKNDKDNMLKLLNLLNINFIPNPSNFVFPTGSMMWYRPKVLKPIFDLKLKYDDFPKEPIPTTGTLAHAIERVIGIIAEQNNYKVKFHINNKYLIDNIYYLYELSNYIFYIKKCINDNNIDRVCKILSIYNNKKSKIISILEIGKFSLFKIETKYKRIILTIFSIKITIRLGK